MVLKAHFMHWQVWSKHKNARFIDYGTILGPLMMELRKENPQK